MRFRAAVLSVAVALLAVGCGGDSGGTGPNNDANVQGSWTLAVSNLSGRGVSCSSQSPMPITLNQSNNTFTGTYGVGTIICVNGSDQVSFNVQGSIVNGTVNGDNVSFDMDTQDFHHTGTVNGNSMSGTASWRFDFGGAIGQVTLSGNWSASHT